MLNRLGNYIDTLYDRRFDPKNIPAQIMLDDLGAIPYEISSYNRLNGKTARVIPDDPNRTFYYTRSDAPRPPAPAPAPPPQFVSRSLAMSCAAAAAVGAAMVVVGAVHGVWPLIAVGLFLLAVVVTSFVPKTPQPEARPRQVHQVELAAVRF